uniref:Putative transmembrane protein n=1 Tax=Ralstonia solanacearum TaxID=305 RepID=A0A0S4X3W2_RALSL
MRAPDGGVTGIYSKGSGRPLAAYSPSGAGTQQAQTAYADWKFVFDPNER